MRNQFKLPFKKSRLIRSIFAPKYVVGVKPARLTEEEAQQLKRDLAHLQIVQRERDKLKTSK